MQISRALRRMLCCQYSKRNMGPGYYSESGYVSDTSGQANSIVIWTRVDLYIFESGEKKLRIEKISDISGRDL